MTDPVARLTTALEVRYDIERELGEGGMATVYLADDLKHERKVDQARHLALLWCCSLPLVAAACGGESPTEGTEDELDLIEGSFLSVSGNGQVGTLSNPLSDSLIVKVADPSGNGLQGVTVSWRVDSDGMVSPTATETDSEGLAKAQWTLGRVTPDDQTATEQTATASASVSGVGSVSFTATTPSLVPLTDMGASTYFGFPGGLYPGGNVMPQAHADAGQAAAAAVEPLDANGDPSPEGKYVLVSVGHSNTELIFCDTPQVIPLCPNYSFKAQAMADPDVDRTNLAIVRGGCCGGGAESMQSFHDSDYVRIHERLSSVGLNELQVQVVWAQISSDEEPTFLPDSYALAHRLVRLMGGVMRTLRIRYPNLRLVFLEGGTYGGYSRRGREPSNYELGFAMKWLIQAQIDQMANGGTIVDERAGDLNYNTAVPWIGWGPYLWADGVNPRSDGISWPRTDYQDPVHLGPRGVEKAADLLLTFFKTSSQARCWFVTGGTC